jgi:hypothetical protein
MAKSNYKKNLESAMEEVHRNMPRNVVATGKTGVAKEKMLEAIGFSKARQKMKKQRKK